MDRPYEAAVYLKKAAELDSTSSTIRIDYAKALLEAGLPEQSLEVVDAGLARNPNGSGLLYVAAALAAQRADAAAAASLYRRAFAHGLWQPDRFRHDALFDPVRNEPVFLQAIYDTRVPRAFRGDS
jgi:predicted Zn-dependent protease